MTLPSAPKRILVVAAHPDDDVIGCGGLISHVVRDGGAVRVCYLTDGSRSHPGSRAYDAAAIAALREAEAMRALAILGVLGRADFLRLPDSALHALPSNQRSATIDRLVAIIGEFQPDLIAAPWRRDPHSDHMAASELTSQAVTAAHFSGNVAGYEVWLPIRGSLADRPTALEVQTVDLALDARTVEMKRRSILAHVSQTTDLIADDPTAFRITPAMIAKWTLPVERFYFYRK